MDNIEDERPKKRGRYKMYLTNPEIPIPESTQRYQQVREEVESAAPNEEISEAIPPISIREAEINIRSCTNEEISEAIPPISIREAEINIRSGTSTQSECSIKETINETVSEDSDNSVNIIESNRIIIDDECNTDTNVFTNTDDHELSEDTNSNCSNDFIEDYFANSDSDDKTSNADVEDCSAIFNNSDLTKEQSEILLLAYSLRHNLPDIGLQNLLSLINCHLSSNMHKSIYFFKQSFPTQKFIEYYYCLDCSTLLESEHDDVTCVQCLQPYRKSELKKRGQFFIHIPLTNQLKHLLNSNIYTHFRNIDDSESDIINSRVYKKLLDLKEVSATDITLSWNSDGVSLCKSSKKSMWPILVTINELPYRLRRKHIIICGLWYGDKKPPMNMFLKPFIEELVHLQNDGFESTTFLHKEPILIKVHTLLCNTDSVARPMIQNVKQFNGKFGCSYCLHKGEQINVGRGTARVYCYCEYTSRTTEEHLKHVQLACTSNKPVKGVKGPSITSLLKNFDIIHSFPPDYLHSCLEGVAKMFATEWFNSKYSHEAWYLGSKLEEFNNRLLSIKPPCEITRVPQEIGSKYKASEWKSFVIYYSLPCLNGLIPDRYFKHWFLFVYSLSIFLQSKISEVEFENAEKALQLFVANIETLYGKEFMKYNVHLLYHIPLFVKNYGALWAWSTFPYEHYNGIIKNFFHGTQCIPQQICKMYSRLTSVMSHSEIFNDENGATTRANRLFITLMNQCKIKNCIEYGDSLRLFGKKNIGKLTLTERVIIETLVGQDIEETVYKHHRFIYNHNLYHSSNYKRLVKRDNSCIMTNDGILLSITCILQITFKHSESHKYLIMGKKFNILNEQVCVNRQFTSAQFSFVTQPTSSIVCCEVFSIKSKCVNIPYRNNLVSLFPIVNTIETD